MKELKNLMQEAVFVKTGGRDENPEIAKVPMWLNSIFRQKCKY